MNKIISLLFLVCSSCFANIDDCSALDNMLNEMYIEDPDAYKIVYKDYLNKHLESPSRVSSNLEIDKHRHDDQHERRIGSFDYFTDKVRADKVFVLYEAADSLNAHDVYSVAIVLMHSNKSEYFKLANTITKSILDESVDIPYVRWLNCASEDRWRLSIGKAQIWGTQFYSDGEHILPYDKNIKSKEDREKCFLP